MAIGAGEAFGELLWPSQPFQSGYLQCFSLINLTSGLPGATVNSIPDLQFKGTRFYWEPWGPWGDLSHSDETEILCTGALELSTLKNQMAGCQNGLSLSLSPGHSPLFNQHKSWAMFPFTNKFVSFFFKQKTLGQPWITYLNSEVRCTN